MLAERYRLWSREGGPLDIVAIATAIIVIAGGFFIVYSQTADYRSKASGERCPGLGAVAGPVRREAEPVVRASFPNSNRNPATLVRDPRAAPTAAEKAERRKLQEEEGRRAWEEYRRKQKAIDENTARLRALRLAREQKGMG